MSKAIRTPNPGTKVELALIAVSLVLLAALAFTFPQATPTGDRDVPAASAGDAGGSGIANDPFIGRHAEVVASYHQGNPR